MSWGNTLAQAKIELMNHRNASGFALLDRGIAESERLDPVEWMLAMAAIFHAGWIAVHRMQPSESEHAAKLAADAMRFWQEFRGDRELPVVGVALAVAARLLIEWEVRENEQEERAERAQRAD